MPTRGRHERCNFAVLQVRELIIRMAPGVEAKFIIGYVRGLGWGRRIVEALTPA